MFSRFLPVVFVIGAVVFSCFSLFHKGLIPTHDGEYHVIRFYEFDKAVRGGDWYPRWAADLNKGYGIPLFNFVYPLPNYIASFLHLFGISFIDAFKLNMFFASVVGGIFFYLWGKRVWGVTGGVVSSIFYTFSPYHFVDIYVRGSVGEVWSLALFPAVLWSSTHQILDRKKIFVPISAFFLALVIFAHNILALMFVLFFIVYSGFLTQQYIKDKKRALLNFLYTFLLGLGMSTIFWLPALLEKQYTVGLEVFDFKKSFVELYQLLIPSWGSGFSDSDLQSQMSHQIGVVNVMVIFLNIILVYFLFRKKESKYHQNLILFFLFSFFFIFFLMLKNSLFIWQRTPFMNYFQFPWRFLSLEILIASFLAGSIMLHKKLKFVGYALLILSVVFTTFYTKPAYYLEREDSYYITRLNFIDGTNSPGNAFNTIWFDPTINKMEKKISVIQGDTSIKDGSFKTTKYVFFAQSKTSSIIQVNTAYFPGWKALVNQKEVSLKQTKNGLFIFKIPAGDNKIVVWFADTPIRTISLVVSAFSLLLTLFMLRSYVRIKK